MTIMLGVAVAVALLGLMAAMRMAGICSREEERKNDGS
jgi:hypothetical protein